MSYPFEGGVLGHLGVPAGTVFPGAGTRRLDVRRDGDAQTSRWGREAADLLAAGHVPQQHRRSLAGRKAGLRGVKTARAAVRVPLQLPLRAVLSF